MTILGGLAAALLALFFYAAWIEPAWRLTVVRYDVHLANWGARPPVTLVLVADLHAGAPHVSLRRVRRIVARANGLEGDIAILLGDYAAAHPFTLSIPTPERLAAALAELKAPLGTWAVQGNHDWWQDPDAAETGRPTATAQAFARHEIFELDNEAISLRAGADAFWLLGLADQRVLSTDPREESFDDIDAAMKEVTDDAPAILIAHEPDIFPDLPAQVGLTVSGHTHGGQVRVFGLSPVTRLVWCELYSYGHYVSQDQHLVVSGGIGCSKYPLRLGMPPEITVVTVRGRA